MVFISCRTVETFRAAVHKSIQTTSEWKRRITIGLECFQNQEVDNEDWWRSPDYGWKLLLEDRGDLASCSFRLDSNSRADVLYAASDDERDGLIKSGTSTAW